MGGVLQTQDLENDDHETITGRLMDYTSVWAVEKYSPGDCTPLVISSGNDLFLRWRPHKQLPTAPTSNNNISTVACEPFIQLGCPAQVDNVCYYIRTFISSYWRNQCGFQTGDGDMIPM